ncbi:DUF6932 family protein [Stenotrophomonas maltophilia]|uniref:DUF6932 family protein n=1 Tax=Stenotrophomonas maltophilia TaxID=40324 RepID=UPI0021C9BD39|nr:hypothetical protein [Stenotrophomonas maltophilia]MCU1006593.1 hypothetical protein [Stenotrophomonas maltophilia]
MHATNLGASAPIVQITRDEFLSRYCRKDDDGDPRQRYAEPFRNLHDLAKRNGATSIVVGGSFADESTPDPRDIDMLIFFRNSASIQRVSEALFYTDVRFDIQFLAESQKDLASAFLYLLGRSKAGVRANLVHIKLDPEVSDLHVPLHAPSLVEPALQSYMNRVQINVERRKGLIIPIHGIRTHAPWLHFFSLMATHTGWGFAPFVYGRESVTTLVNPWRLDHLVQEFRLWLNEVRIVHRGPICIFAHSLGSYVFARYLRDMGGLNERFCGVIFTGSIVDRKFDWPGLIGQGKVTAMLNTFSSNDAWVRMMPSVYGYGRAGTRGFAGKHPRLRQVEVSLLGHTNMFARDLISSTWMPFFEETLAMYDNDPSVCFMP